MMTALISRDGKDDQKQESVKSGIRNSGITELKE